MYHLLPFDLEDISISLCSYQDLGCSAFVKLPLAKKKLPLSSVMSSGNSHEMHGTVQAFMTYILPLRPIKICPLYQVEGVIMKLPLPNSLDSALVE